MKNFRIILTLCLSIIISEGFGQTDLDQNGLKTTVSTVANGSANPLRFEIATVGFNSYHWQNSGMVVIELFQQYYTTGYEKYVVEIGHGQGANSGSPVVKFVGSEGLQHACKLLVGTPYNLGTSDAGYVNKAVGIFLDVKPYSTYKAKVTYLYNKVTSVTTHTQIKIDASPAGVATSDFTAPTVFDNNLYSTGNLRVSGGGNHYIENGNVGIGTATPAEKLSVNGNIRAREIKVESENWPDYVFFKDYQLRSLKETEMHIREKGHLPGIPSAAEVKANGIDLGDMNARLLKKIEELTLHLIRQDKKIEALKKIVKYNN
jgi:hypothetical protein